MLQDLRSHSRYMRMDDPLWPVVRESARRVLRLEHISIKIPVELGSEFKALCDEISQNIPSRLIFPKVEYVESDHIEIRRTDIENTDDGKLIVIGKEEPARDVCWIESDKIQGWNWLMESCHDLLSAGYPGCIGCGGPNSEAEWNEDEFRTKRKLI